MKLVSIGEVLWDVVGSDEHLGGAPLNFAAHCIQLGHQSWMVSGVGADDRGRRALDRIRAVGVNTDFITTSPDHATGHVSVTLDNGQPSFTIHRPAAYDFPFFSAAQVAALSALAPDWIYFGTLAQTSAAVRSTTTKLIAAAPNAKRFYDVNFRADCFTAGVVRDLLSSATIVKLNDLEIATVEDIVGFPHQASIEQFCRDLASRFSLNAVCVTRGEQGCALLLNGAYVETPAYAVKVVDTIGAGDAFAAALVHAISGKWPAQRAADFANRLGALVASRPGAIPAWNLRDLEQLSVRV